MGSEVKRPLAVRGVARLIECLLPRECSELVVGDLYEEFALRSHDRRDAVRWFMLQSVRSVPGLLWLSLRRWSWLKALAVAGLAFLLLGELEPVVARWLLGSFEFSSGQLLALSFLVGFCACACGGFLSTWAHRGSAVVYSAISSGFIVYALARFGTDDPLWIPLTFFGIAVIAPIVGGIGLTALANQWHRRSHAEEGIR